MSCRSFLLSRLLLVLVAAGAAHAQLCAMSRLVVEEDGRVSQGSVDQLQAAATAGVPLRIGW